jgi:hypothetical protein
MFAIPHKLRWCFVFDSRRNTTKQPSYSVQVKHTTALATTSRSVILIASHDGQLRVRSRLLKMKSSLSPFAFVAYHS